MPITRLSRVKLKHGEHSPLKHTFMAVMLTIVAFFILAIICPWIIPNKSVSDNEHDNKY